MGEETETVVKKNNMKLNNNSTYKIKQQNYRETRICVAQQEWYVYHLL